jgi:uncharacterized protein
VFTPTHIFLGLIAALVIGLSKTAIPGGGLLATPLLAMVVSGRLVAGITLPLLLVADLFALRWYGPKCRREILFPLIGGVTIGFLLGAWFYIAIGSGGRTLEIVIGLTILSFVVLQLTRILTSRASSPASRSTANVVGAIGGFTTFVANAAGPIINTYFSGVGLEKEEILGTSAWFYGAVNAAKVPAYIAIGYFASGGIFFSPDSLRFDAVVMPAVFAGVYGGRALLPKIPQKVFTIAILVLAAGASIKLLFGY